MFAPLPDVDAAFIDFLKDHPALTPLHNARVSHKLAPGAASAIRIASIGGVPTWPWEGTFEYQVDCWGGTQGEAITLARYVVAAAYDFKGPIPDGYVSSTDVTLMGMDSPDATTGRPRVIVQTKSVVHPPEGTS